MPLFSRKNAAGRKDFKKIDKKRIRYVVERNIESGEEAVIGRQGTMNVNHGEIVIVCDGHEVFRGKSEGSEISELMSLGGVTIRAQDVSTGQKRFLIAYFIRE